MINIWCRNFDGLMPILYYEIFFFVLQEGKVYCNLGEVGWGLYLRILHCIAIGEGWQQEFCIAIHIVYCD